MHEKILNYTNNEKNTSLENWDRIFHLSNWHLYQRLTTANITETAYDVAA